MSISERYKQHQRILCSKIRRLTNETKKQLAVRIETLARKANSLNTHDYKNKKNDIGFNVEFNTPIEKYSNKEKSITSPISLRTQ